MKAAVFDGKNLKVKDIEKPKPKDNEVLVKVSACGLCRTDLHYLHGVPTFKKPPIILGHEISGVVEEVGEKVENFSLKDRVLIPPVFGCGSCYYCRIGRPTLCLNQVMVGNHMDGGFAEYISVPAREIFKLPAEIPLQEGCIIADALSTPFHAVKNRARVKPGNSVAVFGCGGVGMGMVQIASLAGGRVIAIDILEEKLEQAKRFGAEEVINAKNVDVAREVRKLTSGGADIAIEVIGNPKTIQQAYDSVKWGGRVTVVGYTHKNVEINAGRLMFREIEILGSLGCPQAEFPNLIELVRRGKINLKEMVTHRFMLQEIERGFELLEKGDPNLIRGIVVI